MNTPKEILEKAKWGKLSNDEVNWLGTAISTSNDIDLYTLIHAIGKAELKQYKGELESFLDYPNDPLISAITVRVLCGFWGLTDQYIDTIVKLLKGVDWDEDEDVKLEALSIIGNYLIKNRSPKIIKLILEIFENEENFNAVRSAAYCSLGRAFGKSWDELPAASKPMNFDTDVDSSIIEQAKGIVSSAESAP
ncbi:HEAT repeat domain-containing protein [Rheinheimera fenheensis]|uniref:HEAT repeat domain-containing protein n=1 Tax=Rheinheimera fenheensis TaxID=3152295 RepID=UPI00325F1F90